jgi:hypothetical protein
MSLNCSTNPLYVGTILVCLFVLTTQGANAYSRPVLRAEIQKFIAISNTYFNCVLVLQYIKLYIVYKKYG